MSFCVITHLIGRNDRAVCKRHGLSVADTGFVEGGFCISIAREKFGATPTFAENHAHFRAFLREASFSTCQSIRFQSRSLLKHAEVSHRSRFLSFSHRQEGSI